MRPFLLILVSVAVFILFGAQVSRADHLCQEICELDGFGGTECWLECSGTPVASNVSATLPNYCISGPSATVGWDYSDPAGSPQSAYQVQIRYQSAPGSPAVDSGKISCSNCSSYFGGQGVMDFNTVYRARVRVWNGLDIPSSWGKAIVCTGDGCSGDGSWQTPAHAYPNVNSPYQFTWSPTRPPANTSVQFTDETLFDPLSGDKQWSWTFTPAGGGAGSSTDREPVYVFNDSSNVYQVTESVRDDAMPAGQYCTGPTQAVNLLRPAPLWRETAPR